MKHSVHPFKHVVGGIREVKQCTCHRKTRASKIIPAGNILQEHVLIFERSCSISDVHGRYKVTHYDFQFSSKDEGLSQCPLADHLYETFRRHKTLSKCLFPTFGSQQSKIKKKNILEILSNFHQLINILLIFQFQQFNLFDVSNLHTNNTLN